MSLVSVDAVVSHHLNPYRSGVARFNQMLAERLGVPCTGILDDRVPGLACPLLSFKVGELGPAEVAAVEELLDGSRQLRLFLHDYEGAELEERLVAEADTVYFGNHEIQSIVEDRARRSKTVWAPGLISDRRRFPTPTLSVFSFGMAHKVQIEMFVRLRELLERTGESYALYMSHANHETSTFQDAELLQAEMRQIFPTELYFVGHLSDVAIYNRILDSTYFAAFFPGGVRANNTSVTSALEQGAAVITNLDGHSPPDLRHMHNVIDVGQCDALPTDPALVESLRREAQSTVQARDWHALIAAIESD